MTGAGNAAVAVPAVAGLLCAPSRSRVGLAAGSRPRVVHVVVAGEVGGAERMLADLASRPDLSRASHVVALMTPSARLSRVLRAEGLDVRERGPARENPAAYLWRSLGPRDAAWLEALFVAERADLVHLHTFGSQVVGTRAALRAGARIVRTEHSSRAYTDLTCWPFARWSLARAHRVVAVSRHISAVVLARQPSLRDRLTLVSNGVDTTKFAPAAASRLRPPDDFTFALVGRLERRKGIDIALHALASVPRARLDVVGDGAERPALEQRAAALGLTDRLRFHGHLDDTRPVVAAAHAALCSSREEGLGVALLEAMAMGKPVVALPVGGVPEFVHDQETGWLAAGRTAAALAERMRDAMRSTPMLPSLGRAARRAVVESYSMQAMCEGYAEVYAGTMGRA